PDRLLVVFKAREGRVEGKPCAAGIVAALDGSAVGDLLVRRHGYGRAGQEGPECLVEIDRERPGAADPVALLLLVTAAYRQIDSGCRAVGDFTEHRPGIGAILVGAASEQIDRLVLLRMEQIAGDEAGQFIVAVSEANARLGRVFRPVDLGYAAAGIDIAVNPEVGGGEKCGKRDPACELP